MFVYNLRVIVAVCEQFEQCMSEYRAGVMTCLAVVFLCNYIRRGIWGHDSQKEFCFLHALLLIFEVRTLKYVP